MHHPSNRHHPAASPGGGVVSGVGQTVILVACATAVAGWVAGRSSTLVERRALRWQATHDALTGLANRVGLIHRAAEMAGTTRPARLSLLLVDLDGFKAVNDVHGHAAGDTVLVQAADRLQRCVRDFGAGAAVVSARLGGDEFAVLLSLPGPAVGTAVAADRLACAVHGVLSQPYVVPAPAGSHALAAVGASIGVALSTPGRRPELSHLLGGADAAMYAAKRRGGGWLVHDGRQDRAPATRTGVSYRCGRNEEPSRPPTGIVRRRWRDTTPLDLRRTASAAFPRLGRAAGPTSGRHALRGYSS